MTEPVLLGTMSFPAHGPFASGMLVLRDLGRDAGPRYAVDWRNGPTGGFLNGQCHSDLDEAIDDLMKRIGAGVRQEVIGSAIPGPFTWEVWGSHKDQGNDDCWTGDVTDLLDVAFEEMVRQQSIRGDIAYACIETPAGRIFQLLDPRKVALDERDEVGLSEAAWQAGMAFGTDGFNEVRGEAVEDGSSPRP